MSLDYPFNVRSKGHRVTKCKNISVDGDRVAVVGFDSIECPTSSLFEAKNILQLFTSYDIFYLTVIQPILEYASLSGTI